MKGLIGKKIGMTQVFEEDGTVIPVTVIQIAPNVVIGERTVEKNGYAAKLVGAYDMKEKRATKPYKGQFPEGVKPKKDVVEFADYDVECSVGDVLNIEVLKDVQYVDIVGTTKGKGYQGVMKRHGFSGGEKTHGSKFKREPGATGQAASPSKVHKGTKMPGRMGSDRKTVQNLSVVKIDEANQLVLVRGAVPGSKNSTVLVKNALKR